MSEAVMECVPNFSEGVDSDRVRAIVGSMKGEGVSLLDWSMDSDHNRSVVTIAGSPDAVVQAAVRAVGMAARLIDLTAQRGVHPRIGAADVIPFVPVSGMSLEQCVLYARQAGWEIWKRYGVPVYFYGAAAARPDRAELEDVRRGQFEGLRELVLREAARRPDIGGPELHPTAGATAVGARRFLVAYNLYLDKPDVAAARAIAKAIRASAGGLKGIKAMGVLAQDRAQVSMNITDLSVTGVGDVFAAVSGLASRYGAKVVDGELIGLLPEQAFEPDSEWVRLLIGFKPEEKILERRLRRPLEWPVVPSDALK
ncbi:MAG TPA: glutamate formimidoyltransferase [Acidobacteriaceae bacterium]|nr:glutamate formimidoyltransferase [Acidobacteriaceae bacterium]